MPFADLILYTARSLNTVDFVSCDELTFFLRRCRSCGATVDTEALFGVGISGSGVGVGRAGERNAPHFNGAFFILAQLLGNWGGVSFTLRMITTRWVTSVPGMV